MFHKRFRKQEKFQNYQQDKLMERRDNTTKAGAEWSEEIKNAVWNKARRIENFDENIWRRDLCGLVINWYEFGNRNSDNGWEIDHIDPVTNGGDDEIGNLQALNWNLNVDKGEDPDWICPRKI